MNGNYYHKCFKSVFFVIFEEKYLNMAVVKTDKVNSNNGDSANLLKNVFILFKGIVPT